MNSTDGAAAEQLDRLRRLVTVATQRLLGDTISVSDDDWRAPSRLPEWSRGHVASHIARQADAICRLASWARTGQRQDMYASPEQRSIEIEEGSGRSGLDLQIDLDTSAERLGEAWEPLDVDGAWDAIVEMRGGLQVPARLLPLARLLEVAIHHVDLDIGYEISDHRSADGGVAAGVVLLPAAEPGRVPETRAAIRFRLLDHGRQRGRAHPDQWHESQPARLADEPGRRLRGTAATKACNCRTMRRTDGGEKLIMDGLGHVEPGGRPLVEQLSPTVIMIKISVGPMDNNAYLLQPRTGASILIDAANDHDRLLTVIDDQPVAVIATTHRHGDHWQALASIAAATEARLVAGRPDVDAIAEGAGVDPPDPVWDGDTIDLGE